MSRTTPPVHHPKSGESTGHESWPSESTESSSSSAAASKVNALITELTAMAGPKLALTVKDRKRATKLRKGGEKVIPTIVALSEQLGLSLPSHPTSAITANVNKATNLVAVHKQLVTATKQVADAIFKAQSEGWDGATVHYTVLKRLSKSDGDIAKALAPATAFFAKKSPAVVKAEGEKRGHRKGVKEPKISETTPAAAASNGAARS